MITIIIIITTIIAIIITIVIKALFDCVSSETEIKVDQTANQVEGKFHKEPIRIKVEMKLAICLNCGKKRVTWLIGHSFACY